MKSFPSGFASWWLASLLLVAPARAQEAPAITSIQLDGTNVIVNAEIPPGIQRVTLESRTRAGAGTWIPRATARLATGHDTISFQLPRSSELEVLRIRADESDPLPAAFYSGTNRFAGQPSAPVWHLSTASPPDRAGDAAESGRDVVESDIWRLRGDTLYFFNQYRGLQVIDVSVPDAATVKGTLPLPASGEQMYLMGEDHILLLAQQACGGYAAGPESQVLVARLRDHTPEPIVSLPLPGYIIESRLVGTALYVATQTYRQFSSNDGSPAWEWGTRVSAFDLSDPASPVSRETRWYPGWGAIVSATDSRLFVALQDPSSDARSVVHVLDISRPDGTIADLGALRPAGWVKDKFKMNLDGEVFTVISEARNPDLITVLETFSVSNPSQPRKLGELSLGRSERLHATRFDGRRVYVVTFFVRFQMDPLWVVDLSDPSNPAIAGELEIPGWSTYLHPMGDRIVAVGIETNQTTVSLFDVADPKRPALRSRVALGTGWSWSEANQDEKAFSVLEEAGLVLVPFQSWNEAGSQMRIQLIDLQRDALAARGVIEHEFQPRRATVHRDRVISVSGRELLSVDATDRDRPEVRGTLELAWPVDRVFVTGEHLIEVNSGSYWYDQTRPSLRIAPAGEPDRVLNEIELRSGQPVLGAAVRGDRLYVVQGPQFQAYGTPEDAPTHSPPLILSVYDLAGLPDLKLLGIEEVADDTPGWGASAQLIWPKPDVLVVAGGNNGYWGPWLFRGMPPMLDIAGGWLWPYPIGGGGRLLAFDVSDASNPELVSRVDLNGDTRWNFSRAHTANGRVYLSHESWAPPPPVVDCDETTGECVTNTPPEWVWLQRWFLNVVDYDDPSDPALRKPTELPGALNGISRGGDILFTVGPHWKPGTNWWYEGPEFVDALAYDGVDANLVDSIELSRSWPHPVLATEAAVFVGRADDGSGTKPAVESWVLSDNGRFRLADSEPLNSPAQNLAVFEGLLALQDYEVVKLLEAGDPAKLSVLSEGGPAGCLGYALEHADGTRERGLWIPLGAFGVSIISISNPP